MKNFRNNAEIEKDIQRLMIGNPNLEINFCQNIIKSMESCTYIKKMEIHSFLEDSIRLFKKKARTIEDEPQQFEESKEKAIKHIEQWEKNIGELSLDDILYMIEGTDLGIVDVGGMKYLSPSSIAALLDQYVIGQDDYKQRLGLTVYTHLLRTRNPSLCFPKSNLLVYGGSGMGKTYGVRVLADKLKIDMGVANGNSLVQEGIQGSTLFDPFTRTLGSKKESMIYVLDEVDKLFFDNGYYNERILQETLNILDDNNTITFPTSFDSHREYKEIPSKNITCIMCGKFDSLQETVRKRLQPNFGFSASKQKIIDNPYEHVTLRDLKKVLKNDEICGRIGNFVGVSELTIDDFVKIMMKGRESVFEFYKNYFEHHNIDLILTEEGAYLIAEYALKNYKDLGVRGLKTVIQRILFHDMVNLNTSTQKHFIKLNEEYVNSHLITEP